MLEDSQVLALAAELNHLLWTEDAPEVPPDVSAAMRDNPAIDLLPINMQCVAHAVVCAGLMLGHGEPVTYRRGSALVVFPEQKQFDHPHFVAKHWWINTSAGLCDLSLNLTGCSTHKPIVYGNRNVADPSWKVVFKDDFKRIFEDAQKSHTAKQCGVFYQTDNKKTLALAEFKPELMKVFSTAQGRGSVIAVHRHP